MARAAVKGCAAVAGVLLAIGVGIPLGWGLYNAVRPHDALEVLFQQVIRSAPISDSYGSTGWDEAEVTEQVCTQVDAATLTRLSKPPQHIEAYPYAVGPEHLLPADVWEFVENKNIFDQCSDHSYRVLSIELQESSSQCRAFVYPRPTCDP